MDSSVHSASRTTVGTVRFAFKTSPQNTTWADMLAVWRAADDIDVFESGWTFDHFYPIFSDSTGPCLEGWITLTALAQATERLRVGVLVTGIHYRHPAVLANMARPSTSSPTAGSNSASAPAGTRRSRGAYGIELRQLKERFDRFEEACEVLVGLLTQETTTFDGKYYQLKDARNEPKGRSSRTRRSASAAAARSARSRITARYADHWNFAGGPPEEFARKRDVLAGHCADIGRDPKEITTVGAPPARPGARLPQVVDDAAALGAEGLDLAIIYLPPPHDPAVLEPLAEAIRDSGLLTPT